MVRLDVESISGDCSSLPYKFDELSLSVDASSECVLSRPDDSLFVSSCDGKCVSSVVVERMLSLERMVDVSTTLLVYSDEYE